MFVSRVVNFYEYHYENFSKHQEYWRSYAY
jgi:hypothetical protein